MRRIVFVVTLALLGCGRETIDVARLSAVLDEALPDGPFYASLSLKMVEIERDGKDVIHCVLENGTGAPITLDASTLPWETPGFFNVNAVTPDGKVLRGSGLVSVLSSGPNPVTLEEDKPLEGDVEVKYLPIADLPRSQDLLLLWSYPLGTIDGRGYRVAGTLVLKKR
jgi:hypothetical protein